MSSFLKTLVNMKSTHVLYFKTYVCFFLKQKNVFCSRDQKDEYATDIAPEVQELVVDTFNSYA